MIHSNLISKSLSKSTWGRISKSWWYRDVAANDHFISREYRPTLSSNKIVLDVHINSPRHENLNTRHHNHRRYGAGFFDRSGILAKVIICTIYGQNIDMHFNQAFPAYLYETPLSGYTFSIYICNVYIYVYYIICIILYIVYSWIYYIIYTLFILYILYIYYVFDIYCTRRLGHHDQVRRLYKTLRRDA